MGNCTHRRICGDLQVEAVFPRFFDTHERSLLGEEWQVCLDCGDAKQVQLRITSSRSTLPTKSNPNPKMLMTWQPRKDKPLPKPTFPGQTKTCTNKLCKETKPIEHFFRNRNTKDGFASWCKSCMREKRRNRRSAGAARLPTIAL